MAKANTFNAHVTAGAEQAAAQQASNRAATEVAKENQILARNLGYILNSSLYDGNGSPESPRTTFYIETKDFSEANHRAHKAGGVVSYLYATNKDVLEKQMVVGNKLTMHIDNYDVAKELADKVGTTTKPTEPAKDEALYSVTIDFNQSRQLNGLINWIEEKSYKIALSAAVPEMAKAFNYVALQHRSRVAELNQLRTPDRGANSANKGIQALFDAAVEGAWKQAAPYYTKPTQEISGSTASKNAKSTGRPK